MKYILFLKRVIGFLFTYLEHSQFSASVLAPCLRMNRLGWHMHVAGTTRTQSLGRSGPPRFQWISGIGKSSRNNLSDRT